MSKRIKAVPLQKLYSSKRRLSYFPLMLISPCLLACYDTGLKQQTTFIFMEMCKTEIRPMNSWNELATQTVLYTFVCNISKVSITDKFLCLNRCQWTSVLQHGHEVCDRGRRGWSVRLCVIRLPPVISNTKTREEHDSVWYNNGHLCRCMWWVALIVINNPSEEINDWDNTFMKLESCPGVCVCVGVCDGLL